MVSPTALTGYSAQRRPETDRTVLCHAPFVSLNFDQLGRVTACCYNRRYVLGTYPANTLQEIWNGAEAEALRETFLTQQEAPGCERCFQQLQSGNFAGALMNGFDHYSESRGYRAEKRMGSPLVLEMEISNTCNLECVMCGGLWSSSIRARREHLPPLHHPYDREFVRQVEEMLPSLAGLRFLGGEPFLIRRYYEIWEGIARLNPAIEVSITTNATFLPARARELLDAMRASITVSMDAVTRETYEAIRVNADFDKVMKNVQYLLDYTRRKGTDFSLAVCPMTHNWRELHLIVEYCESRQVGLYFNTVTRPPESSLAGLGTSELNDVISYLRDIQIRSPSAIAAQNRAPIGGLISQLEDWRNQKDSFETRWQHFATDLRPFVQRVADSNTGLHSDRIIRLLNEFARSRQTEIESAGTSWELQQLLFNPTRNSLTEFEGYSDADVLCAAHLFARFPGSGASAGFKDDESIATEHLALKRGLERPEEQGGFSVGRVRALCEWTREQLVRSRTSLIVARMVTIMDSLSGNLTGLEEQYAPIHLADMLEGLARSGLTASEIARIETHIDRLFRHRRFTSHKLMSDDGTREPKELDVLDDAVELRLIFEALYAFHACTQPPAAHAAFRQRVEHCLSHLSSAQWVRSVATSLRGAVLADVYDYLHCTSDMEFELAIRTATTNV